MINATPGKIADFQQQTGELVISVAIAYLEAEEGDVKDAVLGYRADKLAVTDRVLAVSEKALLDYDRAYSRAKDTGWLDRLESARALREELRHTGGLR